MDEKKRYFTSEDIIDYLDNMIKKRYRGEKVGIFWDNCSTHKSKDTLEWLEQHNIPSVRNIPYTPSYMSVEYYWGSMKAKMRKKLTELKLTSHDKFDMYTIL